MAPKSKKKGSRHLYFLSIPILALIGIMVWQFYKYRIANKSVQKLVAEKSHDLYNIKYKNLHFEELAGNLHAEQIELTADTSVYNRMTIDKTNPGVLLKVTIPYLNILHVRTPKALLKKELDGVKIEIDSPVLEIGLNDMTKDSSINSPAKDIYKLILGNLLRIKFDSMEIKDAKLNVINIKTRKVLFTGNKISVLLTNFLIDSRHRGDSTRIFFSKVMKAKCHEIVMVGKKGFHNCLFEDLQYDSWANTLNIGNFKIIPVLDEEEFSKRGKYQKDRYDFRVENISLKNLDRESLRHNIIKADNLQINRARFKVFRDLSYPLDSISRVGKYPQQYLLQLPIPLSIKKIVFHKCFIEYKEKHANTDSSGKVQFYNVEATIDNVTNIPSEIMRNNICVINFNSNFLNKPVFRAKLSLFLKNPEGKFTIAGSMGTMDAKVLNPLTQPMALARLDKGHIEKMNFDFSGNDYQCRGKLLFLYTGLKISLLKKNNGKNRYEKKGLTSFAANLLIEHSNTNNNNQTPYVEVQYHRDIHKSIFNLIWKTIFEGVKKSIGVNKK